MPEPVLQFHQPVVNQIPNLGQTPYQQQLEIEKVRAMQVRTAAADQATKLLAGKAPAMDRWLRTAACIERYILGQEQTDVPHPAAGRPRVD